MSLLSSADILALYIAIWSWFARLNWDPITIGGSRLIVGGTPITPLALMTLGALAVFGLSRLMSATSIQGRMVRSVGTSAAVVMTALYALGSLMVQTQIINYKITIEVLKDGETVSGSSVIQATWRKVAGGHSGEVMLSGAMPIVNLGDLGWVVTPFAAQLTGGSGHDSMIWYDDWLDLIRDIASKHWPPSLPSSYDFKDKNRQPALAWLPPSGERVVSLKGRELKRLTDGRAVVVSLKIEETDAHFESAPLTFPNWAVSLRNNGFIPEEGLMGAPQRSHASGGLRPLSLEKWR